MKMGYGFDMGGLINNKTLAENILLPLQYHKIWSEDEIQARVTETIELFGLQRSRDLRPYAIPGSQRKLTCVIRAFVHEPQLVFLDDPLTGLKEDNINDLMTYIDEAFARRGLRQIFFTSESSRLAQRLKAEELLISTDWFTARAVA
jgi:ABC-type multidrug transport system ATPase subunit